ncbi:MAG: hypothetical protein ACOYYS_24635 [Chloroflexota bacterium]
MDERMGNFRRFLSPTTLLGIVLIAMLLLVVTLLVMFLLPLQTAALSSLPTAVLNVIPASTPTPIPPTATVTASPTQTQPVPPSPQPGVIGVAGYVQVSGTGADGLRVRDEPGLSSKTLFVAIEAEVFQVTDGPREVDGYTWWRLLSPSSSQYQGWAVANFLTAIEQP